MWLYCSYIAVETMDVKHPQVYRGWYREVFPYEDDGGPCCKSSAWQFMSKKKLNVLGDFKFDCNPFSETNRSLDGRTGYYDED